MKLVVVMPIADKRKAESRAYRMVSDSIEDLSISKTETKWITTVENFQVQLCSNRLRDSRILFLLDIGDMGINLDVYSMIKMIRQSKTGLAGSVAGVLIDGKSDLYTKALAREFVLSANQSGCLFVGRPLVEATGNLANFAVIAMVKSISLEEAYLEECKELVSRVLTFHSSGKQSPKLLCLHACNPQTSNTYALWTMVKRYLEEQCAIQEIALENGEIKDCLGCSYATCLNYSKTAKCVYGGVIVDQVYPAVEECDGLILLCPNYNDALGANLTAFINRLTALYRKRPFYETYLFAIVVSGYSGGDIVAAQVIGAMNMNKTFILPANFALMATANEPGSIQRAENIERRAKQYAGQVIASLVHPCRNSGESTSNSCCPVKRKEKNDGLEP